MVYYEVASQHNVLIMDEVNSKIQKFAAAICGIISLSFERDCEYMGVSASGQVADSSESIFCIAAIFSLLYMI